MYSTILDKSSVFATVAFSSLTANDSNKILTSIENGTFEDQLKNMSNYYKNGTFDLLKKSISLFSSLCDFQSNNSSKTGLKYLKILSKGILKLIISPLIDDLQMSKTQSPTSEELTKAQMLCKWWLTYLPLLNYAFKKKKNLWEGNRKKWFNDDDRQKLIESLEALEGFYHWKILLMRSCLMFSKSNLLLEKFLDHFTLLRYSKEVLEYFMGFTKRALLSARQTQQPTKIKAFLIDALEKLQKNLETEDPNKLTPNLLRGKFSKLILNLSHSIIFGWDGGLYALFNKISPKEVDMLTESGEISTDYANVWKTEKDSKIVIGEGTFGKIRLALTLSLNETASTMKPGEVICLKKSKNFKFIVDGFKSQIGRREEIPLDMILESTWNDYSSGEMGTYTFSPSVYDMLIIPDPEMKFHKGYTMQEFVPVLDASKIFKKNGKFYKRFQHQKSYLISVFESVSNLLKVGVCMTDLKPGNTLYDVEYERGMLIDLAGVVKVGNSDSLKTLKAKYITEITPLFVDPTILEQIRMKDDETVVNLFEYSAYAFGKFIERVALNFDEKEFGSHHIKLKNLAKGLMLNEMKEGGKRLTIEEGLKQLEEINDEGHEIDKERKQMETNLQGFMEALVKESSDNLSAFGLLGDLGRISGQFIDLFASQINPDLINNNASEVQNLQNLDSYMKEFLSQDVTQLRNRVLVLLGSSGSGKSTILQKQYFESLRGWKLNNPIPFFINLAVENNLKQRWNSICKLIKNQKIAFSFIAGRKQYPINLFIDSFDEIPVKMNFVSKFLKELGNNPRNRVVLCCRSELVQKEQDFVKWFSNNAGISKWYIVPLQYTQFNIEKYALAHHKGSSNQEEMMGKLKNQSLKELARTSYMVHLTMEVLPELSQKITRLIIYEKYFQKKMETVWAKSAQNKKAFLEEFKLKEDKLFGFIEESAELLAKILHRNGSAKITNKSSLLEKFLDRHKYSPSLPCMENKGLESIIRLLNLKVEIIGSIPNEKITIGFEHDSMKNYFVICGILKESSQENNEFEILGEKLIFDDISLVHFIVEVVKDNQNFELSLRNIILKSKRRETDKQKDQRLVISAANAISILVAANISFSQFDLSKTRICGANLNDGMFSHANFTEADLTGVVLENCKLDGSLFYKTKMDDVKLGVYPETKILCSAAISCCQFSPDFEELVAGTEDGSIILSDTRKTEKIKLLIGGGGQKIAKFSPNGNYFVTNGANNVVRLWDIAKGMQVNIFSGHSENVVCVSFSPDGNIILSGSEDFKIKLWSIEKGVLLKTLEGHSDSVNSVCFSSKGDLILSGSSDKTIKIWEWKTGTVLRTLEGHSQQINSVCFSANDNLILSGSHDKKVKLWDRKTGTILKSFDGHTDWVYSVAFSSDATLILSGSEDGKIKLWECNSGQLLNTFKGHSDGVYSVCFSMDSNYILSGSSDKSIKLWEKSTGKLVKTFEGHISPVNTVSFSIDEKMILSGSSDNTIRLWKCEDGSLLNTFSFKGHADRVNSVCFSGDGKIILSASHDETIKMWEKDTGVLLKSFQGHSQVISACFSPDASLIVSGTADKTIRLWERETGTVKQNFIGHSDWVKNVCFSPKESFILSCSGDKTIKLWESTNGELLKTYEGHLDLILCLCFSAQGDLFISGSKDTTIKLWEVSSGKLIRTFRGHSNTVVSICFSSDGNMILSCSRDSTVRLWELATGALLKTYEGHSKEVLAVRFSADLNWIFSASADRTIKRWDRNTAALLKSFSGHCGWVLSVCFSPDLDGSLLLSGSQDHLIKLWERKNGTLITTFEGHSDWVQSVAFSPDGNFILSGSADKTVNLWDKATSAVIKTFRNHLAPVNHVCFSSDGKLFASCSDDQKIYIFSVGENFPLIWTIQDNAQVISICFTSDGKFILSGSGDNLIKLWEIESGKKIKIYKGHTQRVNSVCLSPNSENFILSGSNDKTVKLWDRNSETLVKSFQSHTDIVNSVCFSPDGNKILSGSFDSTIKLWDIKTGKLLKNFDGHNNKVKSVCFSKDGNAILSGANDGSIKRWDLPITLQNKNDFEWNLCRNVFSNDGNLILSKTSENHYKLWERSSGILISNFEENENYIIPMPIYLIFKRNLNTKNDFICSKTLSGAETHLFCAKMLIINPILLSEENQQIFLDKNAIVHPITDKYQSRFKARFNSKRYSQHIRKTCNCLVV